MRIKTRIRLSIILSLVMAAIVGLLLFLALREVNEMSTQARMADELVKGVAELGIVTHEYLLHPEERSLIQWQSKYSSLSKVITGDHFKSPDLEIVMDQMLEDLKRLKADFSDLVINLKKAHAFGKQESAATSWELQDRLIGGLLVKSQAAVAHAFQLQRKIEIKLKTTQKWVFLLIILTLLTFTASFVGISLWINKSIGGPIATLEKGTQIIGNGNLGYKVSTTAKDEVGQLSRAFDKMTGNLRKTTASIVELNNEIDERRLLQNQLIRSERLAVTGQLAASIAHEINSPLQGITILLNSMAKTPNLDEKLLENLGLVKGAFVNIRDIVKKLLDLNRPGKENKQSMNINSVIEDNAGLLKNYLKKYKVKTILNLSSKVPNISASPQQLGQVFINLVSNAVEAMIGASESKDGGKSREIADRAISINTNIKKNNIIIKVADTGPGISKEDLEHIFDPFYTRKKKMGMGIGLSICHGIIEDHNGTIAAINASERGTVFTITLPI